MAVTGGFFNSLDGDRKYYADDFNRFFEGLVGHGVFENVGGGLRVVSSSGMNVRVRDGKLVTESGHWLKNDADITVSLDPAETMLNRIDAIVAAVDSSTGERTAKIYVKTGTPATNPGMPSVTRDETLEEYVLAWVRVNRETKSISQSAITDTRGYNSVCGFVTGLIDQVDTDNLFKQYQTAVEEDREKNQTEFDEWFAEIGDAVQKSTLVRSYTSHYTTGSPNEKVIPVGIPEFTRNLDVLQVFIEGRKLIPDIDYKVSASDITLTLPVNKGTTVSFECFKSIDGAEAETVVSQVNELQKWRDESETYVYRTTGQNDNANLIQLVSSLLGTSKQAKIEIVGSGFNIGSPMTGSGTTSNKYKYFDFTFVPEGKRVILDFGNCDRITADGILNNSIIFFGGNVLVENLSITAADGDSMLFVQNGGITFKNCDITLNGSSTMCGARGGGVFEDCKLNVTSIDGDAYAFWGTESSPIIASGCTAVAYSGQSSRVAAGGYIASGAANAILLLTNCLFPEIPKESYFQTNSIKINGGKYALHGNICYNAPNIHASAQGENSGTIVVK